MSEQLNGPFRWSTLANYGPYSIASVKKLPYKTKAGKDTERYYISLTPSTKPDTALEAYPVFQGDYESLKLAELFSKGHLINVSVDEKGRPIFTPA